MLRDYSSFMARFMMTGMGSRIFILLSLMTGALLAQRRPIQPFPPDIVPPDAFKHRDALEVDPVHYQLEFENDRMRVLRLTLKPNEAVPLHDAGDALIVCLKECHLRLDRPASHSEDLHLEAGKSRWVFGDARIERNLGSQPLEMLLVEPKGRL
jgi:hypothetical protein